MVISCNTTVGKTATVIFNNVRSSSGFSQIELETIPNQIYLIHNRVDDNSVYSEKYFLKCAENNSKSINLIS